MSTSPASRPRGRRRSLVRPAAGTGLLGLPVTLGYFHPVLGAMVGAVEIAAVLVVVFVMLFSTIFGSETTSERCFRLLRWIANRPEPAAPPPRAPLPPPPTPGPPP